MIICDRAGLLWTALACIHHEEYEMKSFFSIPDGNEFVCDIFLNMLAIHMGIVVDSDLAG